MARARRGAARSRKCCPCPLDIARDAFKAARSCSSKKEALKLFNAEAAKEVQLRKGGQRSILYREALSKQNQAAKFCAIEERADSIRFNGLGRVHRRRRRRRR